MVRSGVSAERRSFFFCHGKQRHSAEMPLLPFDWLIVFVMAVWQLLSRNAPTSFPYAQSLQSLRRPHGSADLLPRRLHAMGLRHDSGLVYLDSQRRWLPAWLPIGCEVGDPLADRLCAESMG